MASLSVTTAAWCFIARMMRASGMAGGAGLRLSIRAGGCSGYAVDFTIEPSPLDADSVIESDGVRLFLPREIQDLPDELSVDFIESRLTSGFIIHSPSAQATCCGSAAPAVVSLARLRPPPRPS
jgi:iron-sulfur cluster assembly accessory protein